jgi:hypothetical protein
MKRQLTGELHQPTRFRQPLRPGEHVGRHVGERGKDVRGAMRSPVHRRILLADNLGGCTDIGVLQLRDDLRDGAVVVMWQRQTHAVQELVAFNAPSERRPNHPADKLCDERVIDSLTEGHHHLRTWAVPAGRERRFEEDDADFGIVNDFGRLDLAQVVLASRHIPVFVEAVGERRCGHVPAYGSDLLDARRKVRVRYSRGGAVLYLYNKDRGYNGVDPVGVAVLFPFGAVHI